jgi:hypothetical protein
MVVGDYVSVCAQRDAEQADVERETRELAGQPRAELNELALIYVKRGLDKELAKKVAEQLSTHDRLGAHLRDELGIDQGWRESPVDVRDGAQPGLDACSGMSVAPGSTMRRILQALSISALALAFASAAHAQISFDVRTGTPPPAPRAYRVPPQPGPDYVWVDGYWYPVNGQYRWHNGYWTRPPYSDAYWVAPYHDGDKYYTGHWEGSRGDVHHDHSWDQSGQRDERWGEGSPRGTSGSYEKGSQRSSGSYGSTGQMTREQAQAIVRSAYQGVLGREPDPASAGWVDRVFNDHWSQQQLENELRNSAEYRQKHPGR